MKIKKEKSWFSKIKKVTKIPISIRWVSISLFLFMMGRGLGGDTFFSVYVKSFVGDGIGLTLIGALLAFIKLCTVIPVGAMNDQGNTRQFLFLGKIIYVFSGLFYFLAGAQGMLSFLIIAVVLNGIASSMMFPTYRSLYGRSAQKKNHSKVFGIYYSSINIAYVIGALISSILVFYIELKYMYLFVIIFALLSLLQDRKIQDFLHKKVSLSRRKRKKVQEVVYEVDEDLENVKKIIGKKGVINQFFREIGSFDTWKKMFKTLKGYGPPMYIALASSSLTSFMNYVGFLFIPIIAVQNSLSLSEIALLFAVMRLPYVINIFVGGIGDKYSKKILIASGVIINAVLYMLLGFSEGFLSIVAICFGIALTIALLAPVASGLVVGYTKQKDKGLMAGIEEFVGRSGDIVGALGFGCIAWLVGMSNAFILLGTVFFVLGSYLLAKKLLHFKTKDNEKEKELLAKLPYGSKEYLMLKKKKEGISNF